MSVNDEAVKSLREIADLLEDQKANPFRVNAYRRAANTVESLSESLRDIVATRGISGLTDLPGIGEGIARSIYEFVATGEMSRLDTLRGGHDPVHLFQRIPGVGPVLARKIYDHLHISSLEALELAVQDGRLEQLPGMGRGRVEMIEAWLASALGKRKLRSQTPAHSLAPPVSMLLDIDRRYREQAKEDKLPKIAPKRFNPKNERWLPIMHATRGEWHFTALFSNTRAAHELHRTRDWVVIYFYDQHYHEGQCTVVTENRGELIGKRVVRGRAMECRVVYAGSEATF